MENEKRLIDVNTFRKQLIDRQITTAFFNIEQRNEIGCVIELLDKQPTIDAVEVKCKVGDWVYALWAAPVKLKYIIYCAEVKEIRMAIRNCRLTTTYILEPIEYRGHRQEYRDDDFSKLVFLTCEEAEEALAKMDGDENA